MKFIDAKPSSVCITYYLFNKASLSMKTHLLPVLSVVMCLIAHVVSAQMQCGTDQLYKNRPEVLKQINEQIKRMQNLGNIVDSNTVFTIPVVFIIYHKGETLNSGSNISEAEILQTLKSLNDAFRARNSYAASNHHDMKIELALANCGDRNSIVRVDASSVPNYASNGLNYNDLIMMFQLRLLHNWNDRDNYITIELVHKINGAGGYAGYLEGYTFIDLRLFGIGVLAHELGHVLNLKHTFEGDYNGTQCPVNNNPETDGDMISDTPPHRVQETCYYIQPIDINPCDSLAYGDIFDNFLSYSTFCWSKFTPKQIYRARNSVATEKPNWFNSSYLSGQTGAPSGISNLKCDAGSLTLSANGCLGIYSWYATPSGGDTLATGANFITPHLDTTTTYYVDCKVATCSASIRTPVQAIIIPLSDCYCPSYASYSGDEDIINVNFAGINNSSTCSTTGGPGSLKGMYSDYTLTLAAPVVHPNQSYPFSVGLSTCGAYYGSLMKIFIDFNGDKDFDDAGEEVYASPSVSTSSHTESGTITIPANALSGITRMRIVNVEQNNLAFVQACGTYGYGETEDYALNISACPATVKYESINQNAGTYKALHGISSKANVSSPTVYIAGKSIILLPGFSAGPSEVFSSTIGNGCP